LRKKRALGEDVEEEARIVACCRGPYCVYAIQAVERLNRRGIAAPRIGDGVAEWRAAGLAVAVTEEHAL
jgi:ArsR family transcriptional regulator